MPGCTRWPSCTRRWATTPSSGARSTVRSRSTLAWSRRARAAVTSGWVSTVLWLIRAALASLAATAERWLAVTCAAAALAAASCAVAASKPFLARVSSSPETEPEATKAWRRCRSTWARSKSACAAASWALARWASASRALICALRLLSCAIRLLTRRVARSSSAVAWATASWASVGSMTSSTSPRFTASVSLTFTSSTVPPTAGVICATSAAA